MAQVLYIICCTHGQIVAQENHGGTLADHDRTLADNGKTYTDHDRTLADHDRT